MCGKPLISIITLTYKTFDSIFENIQSVLNQDYPNIEYIIADDGSENFPEDKIREFVNQNAKYNLKNFVILHKKENQGTVRNANGAYKLAKGIYLFPLSGDDMFYKNNVVSRIVHEFENRNCDMLITSRLVINDENKPVYFLPHFRERKKIYNFKTAKEQYSALVSERFYDMASGSVMYVNKKLFEQMGCFDESYCLWEDAPFLAKYMWKRKVEFAYDIVSIYYKMGGVSSGGQNPLMKKDCIHYNQSDRVRHFAELDKFTKAQIDYINQRYKCKNFGDVVLLYFRHPLVFISKNLYKLERKLNAQIDRKLISKMEKKDI